MYAPNCFLIHALTRSAPQAIPELPKELQPGVVHAYVLALRNVFIIAVPAGEEGIYLCAYVPQPSLTLFLNCRRLDVLVRADNPESQRQGQKTLGRRRLTGSDARYRGRRHCANM